MVLGRRARPALGVACAAWLTLAAGAIAGPATARAAAGADSPARGAAASPTLVRALERSPTVHVTSGLHTFEVRGPRAMPEGLGFDRALGWPPRRPALFATGWDTIPPPPNPIPWSAIASIERVHSGTRAGAIGGAIGAAVVAVPIGAMLVWGTGGDATAAVVWYGGAAVAAGAMLGALFGGMSDSREVLYDAADASSGGAAAERPLAAALASDTLLAAP